MYAYFVVDFRYLFCTLYGFSNKMSSLKSATVLLLVIIISCNGQDEEYSVVGEHHNSRGRCTAYCNENGFYERGFYCPDKPDIYCCGTKNTRECCSNRTLDISDDFDDVYYCPNSSWWLYHWEMIMGLLGSIVLLLVLAACCCQCITAVNTRRARRGRGARVRDAMNSAENGDDDTNAVTGRTGRIFDPSSPNAFVPPDYETLPKDPPKYNEIYAHPAGFEMTNPAFHMDEGSVSRQSTSAVALGRDAARYHTNCSIDRIHSNNARPQNDNNDTRSNSTEDAPPPYEPSGVAVISVTHDGQQAQSSTGSSQNSSDTGLPPYTPQAPQTNAETAQSQAESTTTRRDSGSNETSATNQHSDGAVRSGPLTPISS